MRQIAVLKRNAARRAIDLEHFAFGHRRMRRVMAGRRLTVLLVVLLVVLLLVMLMMVILMRALFGPRSRYKAEAQHTG